MSTNSPRGRANARAIDADPIPRGSNRERPGQPSQKPVDRDVAVPVLNYDAETHGPAPAAPEWHAPA